MSAPSAGETIRTCGEAVHADETLATASRKDNAACERMIMAIVPVR